MPAQSFIHIKSDKSPVLTEEDEELVNEGTYGMALAQYLEAKLQERSYDIPFICYQDRGWWVEVLGQPFTLGVCVCDSPESADPHELCVTVSAEAGRSWSWTPFRSVDTASRVKELFRDLTEILSSDEEIEVLGLREDFPLPTA